MMHKDCSPLRSGSLKWDIFSVFSNTTKKPYWAKAGVGATNPPKLWSFSMCDSSEICVRSKCRNMMLTWHLAKLSCSVQFLLLVRNRAKLLQPLQVHVSLLFSPASDPLYPFPLDIQEKGSTWNFTKRGGRPDLDQVRTSIALAFQLPIKASCNKLSFFLGLALWGEDWFAQPWCN